jgi:hypothetical protein
MRKAGQYYTGVEIHTKKGITVYINTKRTVHCPVRGTGKSPTKSQLIIYTN